MYCKKCGKKNIEWVKAFGEGYVCKECSNDMFVCPRCGIAYETDDLINGDVKNGFCAKCNEEKL